MSSEYNVFDSLYDLSYLRLITVLWNQTLYEYAVSVNMFTLVVLWRLAEIQIGTSRLFQWPKTDITQTRHPTRGASQNRLYEKRKKKCSKSLSLYYFLLLDTGHEVRHFDSSVRRCRQTRVLTSLKMNVAQPGPISSS